MNRKVYLPVLLRAAPLALWRLLRASPRWLVPAGLVLLVIAAYAYSAPLADVGDTWVAPNIVVEGLRALTVVQIARALKDRWGELNPPRRALWALLGMGIALNLARGRFAETPLTLSPLLLNVALVGLTYLLMAGTRRERELARENAALKARLEEACT